MEQKHRDTLYCIVP